MQVCNCMILIKKFCIISIICGCFIQCKQNNTISITNAALEATYNNYLTQILPHTKAGNFNKGLATADSIYHTIKPSNYIHQLTYYYMYVWISRAMGNYEQTIKYCDSAITIYKKVGINEETANYYSLIVLDKSFCCMKIGKYDEGYKLMYEAKKAIALIKNICGDNWPLDAYALVLYQQQEYALAKDAFVDLLNIINQCHKPITTESLYQKQNLLGNIGLCYTKLGKWDSAKYYYLQALNAIEKIPSIKTKDTIIFDTRFYDAKGVVLGNLAKVFVISNPDTAILLYQQSIQNNLVNGVEIKDVQLSMSQLAEVLLQQQKNEQAYAVLNQLKQSLDTLQNLNALVGYKKALVKYYKNINQHQQALSAIENYTQLKDSLQEKEIGIKTTNVNKELKDREQQQEIQLLQKDKQIDDLYLKLSIGFLISLSLLAFFVYRNYYKSKKQNNVLVGLNNEISQQQKQTQYALQQLEVSNAEKDRIMQVVAHDLRNPIGAIVSLAHFVNESEEVNHYADAIKMIETSGNQSLELINELLEWQKEKKEALHLTETDVKALLKQTVTLLQHKLTEKKQNILFNLPPETITLLLDVNKMERVLSNLVTNAIKFSHTNTSIKISLSKTANQVLIAIQDNGIGIAKEDIPLIFEKGATLSRKGTEGEKSFGLGLSICKQIVEAHNGKIWVESEEGKGSCFYVYMPV